MMEKMREEFEAWCRERGYTLRPAETNCGVRVDGSYGHRQVQLAWEAWRASRAALCVELNSAVFSRDKKGEGGLMLPERVFKAMSDAGVSYK